MSEEQARHEQALRRVKAKRDLSAHAVVYVVVNAFLIGIWWFNGQGYFWPGWPHADREAPEPKLGG